MYDLPTWLKIALGVLVGGILFYGIVVGKRCPKCHGRMAEISEKDPLKWYEFQIVGIPRVREANYRCGRCGFELSAKELTAGHF
jgi:hypothetical protein